MTNRQLRIKNKKYHKEHREEISLRKKQWAKDNPDKVNKHKKDNPDYHRIYIKNYRKKHPEKMAAYARKRAYGITKEWFDRQLKKQKGKCAVCFRMLIKPNVDHDHITGKVREILCWSCNMAIGYFKENTKVLNSAIKYLNKHKKES